MNLFLNKGLPGLQGMKVCIPYNKIQIVNKTK